MLRTYFTQGGPMMFLLAVCSVMLLAVLIERFITLGWRRVRFGSKSLGGVVGRRGGESRLAQASGRPPLHERRLKFYWDIPPQIGLLGTVLGLIQIFQGDLGAEAFGRGVGTACLTTIYGLGIALVARVSCYLLDGFEPEPTAEPRQASCATASPASVVTAPPASFTSPTHLVIPAISINLTNAETEPETARP